MGKLAVIGTIVVREGSRQDVVRAVLAHRERSLKNEPGTLQFEVLVPPAEPTKILLYELYADAAAFAAHMKGASMARSRKKWAPRLSASPASSAYRGLSFLFEAIDRYCRVRVLRGPIIGG